MMKSETRSFVLLLALLIGIRAAIFGFVLAHAQPTDIWQFNEYLILTLVIAAVPVFILLSRERL